MDVREILRNTQSTAMKDEDFRTMRMLIQMLAGAVV